MKNGEKVNIKYDLCDKQKYKPLNFKNIWVREVRSCIKVYERFHQGACPIETVERILKNFSTQIEKD